MPDDCLYDNRPLEAEALFQDSLLKAQMLGGFARAKIRFTALKSLAKTAQWSADMGLARAKLDWCASSNMASAMSSANGSLRMLQAAEFFCAEAEAKAKEWFGPDSHRTIWVDRKRLEVAGELQKIVENGAMDVFEQWI